MKNTYKSSLDKSIYIFGAGGASSWVLSGFKREGIEIEGFLDDNFDKIKNISGIPVYNPYSKQFSETKKRNSLVVFCVMSTLVDEISIKNKLVSYGWKNYFSFDEFAKKIYQETKKIRLGMIDPKILEVKNNIKKIKQVRNILSDDISKKTLDGFLKYVVEMDNSILPKIEPNQYFPKNIPRWNTKLKLIDCGGYNGDTVLDAIDKGYEIEKCLSFEPDPHNFTQLVKTAKKINELIPFPCGVSNKTEILLFKQQKDMGSFLDPNGDIPIQCVSLDDVASSFKPNMIKMDIEGYEEKALFGAINILNEYKPGLAISVYHKPSDIYKIPLFIMSIYGKNCDYYLRRHSRSIADTIFYAKPHK